jgi:hypothetical protein
MRRIAAFLGIGVNHAVWPSLVRAADFKEMRARGEAITPGANRLFGAGGVHRFFNNGTKGRWFGILTISSLYDAKVCEKFSPNLAAWLEGSRRATGNPREAADLVPHGSRSLSPVAIGAHAPRRSSGSALQVGVP